MVRAAKVKAPDGREWRVSATRLRLPRWRQIDLSEEPSGDIDLFALAFNLIAGLFTVVLIPLAIALVEFPLALARAVFSRTAWVEAVSHWPHEERYVWKTERVDAPIVHASVAAHLAAGETLNLPRAELVERPPLPG